MIPINPTLRVGGPEWSVGSLGVADAIPGTGATQPAGAGGGSSFGGMLTDAVSKLAGVQNDAAQAAQALATGTASDPAQVVNAVEHARLSMQLASQIRGKAVEAYQDIFHTQV